MNMDVLRALRFRKLLVLYAQLGRLRVSMHQIQEEIWTHWSLHYWGVFSTLHVFIVV